MLKEQNISGINYERAEKHVHRRSFINVFVSVALTMLALAFVAYLLFNPIKPRPSIDKYVKQYNQKAASQDFSDRLPENPVDTAAGTIRYLLPASGLDLALLFSPEGFITGLTLADDQSRAPSTGWQTLTPAALREQIYLSLVALDPKMTMVSLYRTFDALGIDLDQPLTLQSSGTRESNADGMNLKLTHDSNHFTLSVQLDILDE